MLLLEETLLQPTEVAELLIETSENLSVESIIKISSFHQL